MATGTAFSQKWAHITLLICISQLVSITYVSAAHNTIIRDISTIKSYWANLKEYEDISQRTFGVMDTGLPAGCQVEQVQVLHRHAARYPSSDEYRVIVGFIQKVVANQAGQGFSGSLSFLNTWTSQTGSNDLVQAGVRMGYESGTNFWTRYGRLLYNATPGQTSYNDANQVKPLLRCNALGRVLNTANAWAAGFFGQYNATSKYTLMQIPFVNTQNSTLAGFLSCLNYLTPNSGLSRTQPHLTTIAPFYLGPARDRLSANMPTQLNLTVDDVYAMQALCTYEYYALGSSDFCRLFTLDEWKGFEYLYDSFMFNTVAFGNPGGRAVGLGILQEMLARLTGQLITSSESSVNSTLSSSNSTFPLDQKFYFDATNDFTIVAALTAMSLDYFKSPLPLTYPPPPNRRFRLKNITPYAGRLITEKIGCVSANPTAMRAPATQYSNNQYGYSASAAQFKFVRMRLNNGILPLNTIRGGACRISGRTDGLCPLDKFVESQANAAQLANYQFLCFANFTVDPTKFEGDGTYFP